MNYVGQLLLSLFIITIIIIIIITIIKHVFDSLGKFINLDPIH